MQNGNEMPFNREINEKYFFSDMNINASKSPFIKSKIKIIYSDESLDRMVSKIKEDNLSYDDFKVSYVKSEQGDVQYEDRLEATRKIGFVVNGYPDMHKPRNPLAVTKINGLWILENMKEMILSGKNIMINHIHIQMH